ncbi:MAG: hypothetical protein WCO66_03570 [Candidatus Absconditabacteria bacterium]
MHIFRKLEDHRDIINLTQDEEGHWHRENKPQQEADNGRHVGPVHIGLNYHHIDHDIDLHVLNHEHRGILGNGDIMGSGETTKKVAIIGLEDSKRELIETLQHIVEQEGHRGIVIIGAAPFERNIKEVSLSDFADKIIEDTRREVFLIQNTLDSDIYIDSHIKEINKGEQKYAKKYHKFHNQKPSGPKGQYSNSRRK